MPDAKTQAVLQEIVNELSNKYDFPNFEPHATLLGDIEIDLELLKEKTTELAKQFRPFEVTLGKVEISTTYWRYVFVRVDTSGELVDLNMKARELIDPMPDDIFMPHISLAYGEDDAYKRQQIADEIKLPNLSFMIDKIVITPADPNPTKWKHLSEIKLG